MVRSLAARLAAVLSVTAALLTGCAPQPEAGRTADACRDRAFRAAAVPARLVDGLLVLPGRVNGQPVRLRVDTGANLLLMLWANAARQLGVATSAAGHGDTLAGAVAMRQGTVETLEIGDLVFSGLVTAVLPQRTDTGAEGQLGVILLETGDLMHGFPLQPLAMLIDAEGCEREVLGALGGGQLPVVTVPLTQPFRDSANAYLFATLDVEGQPLLAMLDTGMTATALTQAGLTRVGRDRPLVARTEVRNIDGRLAPGEIRRFATVRFGPLGARDANLLVLPDSALTRRFGIEAFVGADLLFAQPALISAKSRTLYLLLPPRPR